MRGSHRLGLGATAGQDREHGATLQRRLALDHCDVGHPRGDRRNLGPGHLRMRSLAPAEAHLDFHFVTFFQEAPRRAHTNLQVVLVGTRSQADLLDLRHALVLLGVAGAFVLLEPESAQVRDPTHWRIRRSRDFDEVEAGVLRAAKRLVNRNYSNLLALLIDNTDLRDADLAIGSRAGWDWRTRVKWSTGYGRLPPYFFFGPLLTIGGFGAGFFRVPP